jgi:hypothetical protein
VSKLLLFIEELLKVWIESILHDSMQEKTEKKVEQIYFVLEWGSRGSGKAEFEISHSIAIDSFGNLFVTDTANDRIQKFTSNGTFLMHFGNKTEFKQLEDIEIDSFDNIYITDKGISV